MTSLSASVAKPADGNKAAAVHIEHTPTVIRTPEDVTPKWLSTVLKTDVKDFKATQIGTGQLSSCYRIELSYDSERAARPPTREVLFYREVAPQIAAGPVAKVYHSSFDAEEDTCCISLDDLSPCEVGDDIRSCTLEQARLAMESLGKIHSPFINNVEFQGKPWLNPPMQLPPALFEALGKAFLERYDERIEDEHKEIVKRFVAGYGHYQETQKGMFNPLGVVHADYRMDNILFKHDDSGKLESATAVDWQTIIWGPIMVDVAYFLGCALTTENRRAWEEELIDIYYKALGPDPGFTMEQCADSLRLQTFFGVVMAVVSPMLVQRTDRGDNLFMALLDRHCHHVIDRNALDMVPQPAKVVPLKPLAEDDARTHEPGQEKLWQESWYFDFADPEQGIGGYVRLGIDPTNSRSWYTATICGPSRPTIAILDFEAPLPNESLTVRTNNFTAKQDCKEPMKSYHVSVTATKAESFDDPSDMLQGKQGKSVSASMDLVWTTAGVPYAYRLATRYEIPCTVSGKLTIGNEVIELSRCLGQRDHSWGVRDWWSMDWVWNATHLDDGTHIHSLDLRIPQAPRMSCGYVQGPKQEITEIESCIVEEKFRSNGLPVTTPTDIKAEDGSAIKLDMQMMGHGPLRLVSNQGKVDMFPRAWGLVKTEDGRSGVAWMEWNRNSY